MNALKETLEICKNKDIRKAKQIQFSLRKNLSLKDSTNKRPRTIFGVDLAYKEEIGFVSIVVWNNISEEVNIVYNKNGKIGFPYIPGFLSFREFPLFYSLYKIINVIPDLIIFDGHGYAHPRRMGLATHAGILLNVPTIGCAKSRLVGTYNQPPNKINAYSKLYHRDELIGYVLRTRENVKPMFISPGNNISFENALKIIMDLKRKTKLPYIMQLAHNSCESYKRIMGKGEAYAYIRQKHDY